MARGEKGDVTDVKYISWPIYSRPMWPMCSLFIYKLLAATLYPSFILSYSLSICSFFLKVF